jgi:hypothetical protein
MKGIAGGYIAMQKIVETTLELAEKATHLHQINCS